MNTAQRFLTRELFRAQTNRRAHKGRDRRLRRQFGRAWVEPAYGCNKCRRTDARLVRCAILFRLVFQ